MFDKYYLGNIINHSFEELEKQRQKIKFVENSHNHPEECLKCKYINLCRGNCNRQRILIPNTNKKLNYYCRSYKAFFDKYYETLKIIALNCKK